MELYHGTSDLSAGVRGVGAVLQTPLPAATCQRGERVSGQNNLPSFLTCIVLESPLRIKRQE